jgi:DNA-directed RNA polymerase specialized sigma24 family protein
MTSPEDDPQLSEEDLAVRARHQHDRGAQETLLDRHLPRIDPLVHALAAAVGLPGPYWADAEQTGRLAILQAIAGYNDVPPGPEREGRFCRLLNCVVRRRLWNLARSVRRHAQHCCSETDGCLAGRRPAGEPADPAADPARIAEQHERVEWVRRALGRLTPAARRLVETLVSDESVLAVAAVMHLPYGVAKRRRERIIDLLQQALSPVMD